MHAVEQVLSSAYAHELVKFGLPAPIGLTNYAAAYATGLLVARRALEKLGLGKHYVGNTNVDGTKYEVAEIDGAPRPFKAVLDVGLKRTTTGNKVFAIMKGAADGGVLVPHNEKRFVGYDKETKELDAEVLKSHIFGEHVSEYMALLQEENPGKYEQQFSRWIKAGVDSDGVEEMYTTIHANIRKNPVTPKKEKKKPAKPEKRHLRRKLAKSQRDDRVLQKKQAYWKKSAASSE